MKILREVVAELFSMFAGDARLTIEVIALVILVALICAWGIFGSTMPGVLLLLGCLAIVAEAVVGEAQRREHERSQTFHKWEGEGKD